MIPGNGDQSIEHSHDLPAEFRGLLGGRQSGETRLLVRLGRR